MYSCFSRRLKGLLVTTARSKIPDMESTIQDRTPIMEKYWAQLVSLVCLLGFFIKGKWFSSTTLESWTSRLGRTLTATPCTVLLRFQKPSSQPLLTFSYKTESFHGIQPSILSSLKSSIGKKRAYFLTPNCETFVPITLAFWPWTRSRKVLTAASSFWRKIWFKFATLSRSSTTFGLAFLYNNALFALAGGNVERVSNPSNWGNFLHDRIFQPLDMSRSTAFRACYTVHDSHWWLLFQDSS